MSDSNNDRAANLPATPNPALHTLDRLVGEWRDRGGIDGHARFEWMEGGFYLIQHFELTHGPRRIKGVEYIGYDDDTQTLRSHLMDNHGSNFTYTWEIDGDTLTIWFGDRASDNFYRGTFSDDGNSHRGRWQWPTGDGEIGGYGLVSTRVVTAS
jgi:hypothetical protein